MVTNNFGKNNSCGHWEGSTYSHDGPNFFLFGVGWGELFFVENMSRYVTNVCPYQLEPRMIINNFKNKSLM
jgi:hypothetical protein